MLQQQTALGFEGKRPDLARNKPRGNNPKGIIYYGPYGEMSVQIAPGRGRRGLSSRKVVADRPDQSADIARLIEV